MRRLLPTVLMLLLAAACAPHLVPAPKSAASLAPLGPCPTSSWKPEAPPPTASARTSMVLLAVQEWARFGRQTSFYPDNGAARTEQQGLKERDAPQRITDYWKSVDKPILSGLDTEVPWSAAFISCNNQIARHTIYVERMA